jgi:hypothetical protein
MKQINVAFDDDEFARLVKRKDNQTWHAFILSWTGGESDASPQESLSVG